MANIFLLTTFIFSLIMTSVKSDSFSFSFPSFEPGVQNILVDADANTTSGILQLTPKNNFGKPLPHSVGLSAFFGAIHLSNKKTGKVADFTTEFAFVVDRKGSEPHGDGFTFFLASIDFDFPDNNGTDGGFFGLFDKETAFNTSKNSIVAVEFDSFSNEWDPNFPENTPHIGIDINTVQSAITAPWPIDSQPGDAIGVARISYRNDSKELSVVVFYPNSRVKTEVTVSYPVNFASVLSEWVFVGFSASTGELAETHDILSWSFASFL